MLVFAEGPSNRFAQPQKPGIMAPCIHRDDGVIVAANSAPALPDQDQAERGQRRAISGPLDLLDHETRRGPVDHAGALTDPEQADGERQQANDQQQFAHGRFLARDGRAAIVQLLPEWSACRAEARAGTMPLARGPSRAQKSPGQSRGFYSLKAISDQYLAAIGAPPQLKR